ncbi:MAG: flagellar filament capping protein FliD [Defluviitaleaceae bacterium]|nr:flagellar filament capping protein FliD [Defluviitaleaceae bacterium]
MFTNQMRFTGMSGLDTQGIVEQLMRAHSMRLDRLRQQRDLNVWRVEHFRNTATEMRAFQTRNFSMTSPRSIFQSANWSAFNSNVTRTTSNGSVNFPGVTVSAGTTANTGQTTVRIESVARGDTFRTVGNLNTTNNGAQTSAPMNFNTEAFRPRAAITAIQARPAIPANPDADPPTAYVPAVEGRAAVPAFAGGGEIRVALNGVAYNIRIDADLIFQRVTHVDEPSGFRYVERMDNSNGRVEQRIADYINDRLAARFGNDTHNGGSYQRITAEWANGSLTFATNTQGGVNHTATISDGLGAFGAGTLEALGFGEGITRVSTHLDMRNTTVHQFLGVAANEPIEFTINGFRATTNVLPANAGLDQFRITADTTMQQLVDAINRGGNQAFANVSFNEATGQFTMAATRTGADRGALEIEDVRGNFLGALFGKSQVNLAGVPNPHSPTITNPVQRPVTMPNPNPPAQVPNPAVTPTIPDPDYPPMVLNPNYGNPDYPDAEEYMVDPAWDGVIPQIPNPGYPAYMDDPNWQPYLPQPDYIVDPSWDGTIPQIDDPDNPGNLIDDPNFTPPMIANPNLVVPDMSYDHPQIPNMSIPHPQVRVVVPQYIDDPNFVAPPAQIPDPDYLGDPADAQLVDNPAYLAWDGTIPQIANPAYVPEFIDDPTFIAPPPQIPDPDYSGDPADAQLVDNPAYLAWDGTIPQILNPDFVAQYIDDPNWERPYMDDPNWPRPTMPWTPTVDNPLYVDWQPDFSASVFSRVAQENYANAANMISAAFRVSTAGDARIVVNTNGVETTHSQNDNTFHNVNGASITLNPNLISQDMLDDGPVNITIDVTRDIAPVREMITDFLSEFNEMQRMFRTLTETRRPSSSGSSGRNFFEPLTDEQRMAMSDSEIERWEEQARIGILHRDDTLRRLFNDMNTLIQSRVRLDDGSYLRLSDLGIRMSSNLEEFGQFQIADPARLDYFLTNRLDDVRQMFLGRPGVAQSGGNNLANADHGIGQRINNIINRQLSNGGGIFERAGTTERLDSHTNNAFARRIRDQDTRIENLIRSLERREAMYFARFSRLEVAIMQSNSQMEFLQQMFWGPQ